MNKGSNSRRSRGRGKGHGGQGRPQKILNFDSNGPEGRVRQAAAREPADEAVAPRKVVRCRRRAGRKFGQQKAARGDQGIVYPWGNTYGPIEGLGYTSSDLTLLSNALFETPLPLVALVVNLALHGARDRVIDWLAAQPFAIEKAQAFADRVERVWEAAGPLNPTARLQVAARLGVDGLTLEVENELGNTIETPLLILHSEQDLRCNVEQAEVMFTTLRLLGKEVEPELGDLLEVPVPEGASRLGSTSLLIRKSLVRDQLRS